MGISNIARESLNSITAIIDAGNAGSFVNCYILFSEKLSKGYQKIDEVVNLLDKKFNEGCAKVYLVSNSSISQGFRTKIEQKLSKKNSVSYWQIDDLLKNIEESYSEYWRHSDQSLISYETHFEERINESLEIRKLVEFKATYQKLLSIFIQPNLFLRTEDKQSTKKAFTKINLSDYNVLR